MIARVIDILIYMHDVISVVVTVKILIKNDALMERYLFTRFAFHLPMMFHSLRLSRHAVKETFIENVKDVENRGTPDCQFLSVCVITNVYLCACALCMYLR